jgi:hypothetical protein
VDTLPKEDLTPAALKQREQYAAGLNNAKKQLAKPEKPDVVVIESAAGKMPWELAQKERAKLDLSTMEGRRSSVSTFFFSTAISCAKTTCHLSRLAGMGHPGGVRGWFSKSYCCLSGVDM